MKPLTRTLSGLTLAALFAAPAAFAETLSVAEVHAQRAELSGQQVTVSGEVVKVNNGIMRRNFIHIQDGANEEADRLIVTSQETAQVGDQVTATGTVKLDTDFGMGYFYPTLMEEASITQQ